MRRWFLAGLIGVVLAIGAPAIASMAGHIQHPTVLADASPQALLQQGVTHYEAGQYAAAIQQWQQASQEFARQADPWGQMLALSYLSSAQQQLGQLVPAAQSLHTGFTLIESVAAKTPAHTEIYAKALNVQGKLRWFQGDFTGALDSWQEAEHAYSQAEDGSGVAIALINQARVLQYLGLNHQANSILQVAYQQIQHQPNSDLRVAGLQSLSSILRQIGELDTARSLLQTGISLAQNPKTASNLFLELGNTEWAMANRLSATGRQSEAQQRFQAAQTAYRQAIDIDSAPLAQLNLFRLQLDTEQIAQTLAILPQLRQTLEQLPTGRTAIHAYIHLAESLMKAQLSVQGRSQETQPQAIAQLLSTAVKQSRILKDQRVEAYALGQLGALYEQTQQWSDAQTLTQQALLILEPVDAPEIRYRWEWQLGRLRRQQNDLPGALQSYQTAIDSLQQVRNNLLSTNTDVQFSFRDNVEPVYRQYIELLLSEKNQSGLEKAIQTVDQLQLAELENYLGCTLDAGAIDQIKDGQTAILYPIILSDRIAIIAQLPGAGTVYRETLIPQAEADTTLLALRSDLANPSKTPDVLKNAQTVYDWLIRPIETDLSQANVKTLVFVLDGPLRNIPMAVLHDGDQYLIQKGYAVAIAPQLRLFTPDTTDPPLQVLMGGVELPQEIQQTFFPKIAKVREELEGISQYVDSSQVLLNQAFTRNNLRQQLETGEFSALHWKTHGVFSSDPEETYVVAYQERILAQDLDRLVWLGSRGGAQPLELVVLSACETAQGDKRAVLGLAGLAARTGTRSVLSTLWIAQDTPNTEFMIRFYEVLSQSDLSIAEAVRQAQLTLIEDYGYTTPYIWANYLLIGNWL